MEVRPCLHVARGTLQSMRAWTTIDATICQHDQSLQSAMFISVLVQLDRVVSFSFHAHICFLPTKLFGVHVQQMRDQRLHKNLATQNGNDLKTATMRELLIVKKTLHLICARYNKKKPSLSAKRSSSLSSAPILTLCQSVVGAALGIPLEKPLRWWYRWRPGGEAVHR